MCNSKHAILPVCNGILSLQTTTWEADLQWLLESLKITELQLILINVFSNRRVVILATLNLIHLYFQLKKIIETLNYKTNIKNVQVK